MLNLDSPAAIKKYDASGMIGLVESFPGQCRDAKAIGLKFQPSDSYKSRYENIVCTGLGGSAIGADIARSYVADEAELPMIVNRNYTMPGFVGARSLVITSSYSGNTEETLSAYNDAKARGARIIAITSGGRLGELAKRDGFPVVAIPGGLPPRCALGYSFFPLLIALSKLGIIKDRSADIDEAIKVMEGLKDGKLGSKVKGRNNIAKEIAKGIYGKYPIIYGSQDRVDAVVTRWRGQLAENSKTISSSHLFPEMNHNEIVGWANPEKLLKDLAVIMLRDRDDHPRIARRIDITEKIIKDAGVKVIEAVSVGSGLLARIFSLVYTGDFVSYYLAILNKEDPTPVDRITYLKESLEKA